MKKQEIPKLFNIPLFYLEKEQEADGKSIPHRLFWISLIFLMIYFFIVNYGEPGFMDKVIEIPEEHYYSKSIDQMSQAAQWILSIFPNSIGNFIGYLFKYGFYSILIGWFIFMEGLNRILRLIYRKSN